MPRVSLAVVPLVLCTLGWQSAAGARVASESARDRRIVDAVSVGNPASERAHGYAGRADTVALFDGVPARQTREWMHFALKTFDDTDVTLALTFVVADSVPRRYDVVVEDSVVASKTFGPQDSAKPVVDVPVPFVLTKGKTNIVVYVRARGGLTPALREIRTIQDHNELDFSSFSFGATR